MSYLDYAGLSHYKDKSLALYASKFSNPNLLINSNFAIDQRGGSPYTGANKYTVDRWIISGNTPTITPTSNGITITSTASWQGLRQFVENHEQLKGKTVTLSVKLSVTVGQGNIVFGLRDNSGAIKEQFVTASGTSTVYKTTYTIPSDWAGTYLNVFIWSRYSGQTINIEWVKLEIGDTATSYSPPLIAEELLKCQRYYTKIDTSPSENKKQIRVVAKSTNDFSDNCVRLPVRMRAIPAIKLFSYNDDSEGYLYSISNATNKECDTPSIYRTVESFVVTKTNGGLVVDEALYGYYSADAEIY